MGVQPGALQCELKEQPETSYTLIHRCGREQAQCTSRGNTKPQVLFLQLPAAISTGINFCGAKSRAVHLQIQYQPVPGKGVRGHFPREARSPSSLCVTQGLLEAAISKESAISRLAISSKFKIGTMMKPLLQLIPRAMGLPGKRNL